jgi:hypothetical protein
MISLEGTSIFRRVVNPNGASLPAPLAEFLMELDFPEPDHERYAELSSKAQEGTLTEDERRQLEGYLEVDSLLAVLRLKAERSLQRSGEGR